jgi:hypothetical protein
MAITSSLQVPVLAVTPAEALVIGGLSNPRTAASNARTRIYRGTYPYPLTPAPGGGARKYVVLIRDIEATLGLTEDNAFIASPERAEPSHRKRGRPRLSQSASKGASK